MDKTNEAANYEDFKNQMNEARRIKFQEGNREYIERTNEVVTSIKSHIDLYTNVMTLVEKDLEILTPEQKEEMLKDCRHNIEGEFTDDGILIKKGLKQQLDSLNRKINAAMKIDEALTNNEPVMLDEFIGYLEITILGA